MLSNVFEKQYYLKLVLSQCACLAAVGSLAAASSLRAIGGQDATEHELPYVVRLQYALKQSYTTLYYHVCTCSVLTPRWTLTARHCIDSEYSSKYSLAYKNKIENLKLEYLILRLVIRYGNPMGKMNKTQTCSVLDTILTNRRFYEITFDDIALLKTEPIELKQYGRISSMNYGSLYYKEVEAVGYGITNGTVMNQSEPILVDTFQLDRPLQIVVGVLKRCEGSGVYPLLCMSQVCARPTSLCSGDSGGPVIHRSGIVALNSQAPVLNNCQMISDMFRIPDFVFVMALSPYLDWIYNVINSK